MFRLNCFLLASLVAAASAQCTGHPNTNPVYTDAPTLVASTANGARYSVGPATMSPQLTVLHLFGTDYEMGQAYGTLMKTEINLLIPQFLDYVYAQIDVYLQFLPVNEREQVDVWTADLAMNLTYAMTKDFIPQHYFDMSAGMANTSGIDAMMFMHIALFPELIRMSCSMFGAWGPATANTTSRLVQLRALDWSTDGPFQQFPVVVVYHPGPGYGQTFSSMSWAGMMGAITGYSAAQMAISEKVWDHYKGANSMAGYPATFLLEDILRFDMDTDQALSRIASANRTCSIFIGVGDKYNNQFKAIEYSHQVVNVFNDRNYPTYPNHDQFQSLVFVDKHTQPSSDPCFNTLLLKYYGSLDPTTTLKYITSQFQTGDMHIAIYDFENGMMYVANALPPNATGYISNAYDNTFIALNMTHLFATTV